MDERMVSVALIDASDAILDLTVAQLALKGIIPQWDVADGARTARVTLSQAQEVHQHCGLVQVRVLLNTVQ